MAAKNAPPLHWSAAGVDGLEVAAFDASRRFPLGRKRWLRARTCTPDMVATWPLEQRTLLRQWLADGADQRRCDTLEKIATGAHMQLARDTATRCCATAG